MRWRGRLGIARRSSLIALSLLAEPPLATRFADLRRGVCTPSDPLLRPSRLKVHQLRWRDAKSCCQTTYIRQRDIALAAFDPTYVGAMESALVGKFFLRPFESVPEEPNALAECDSRVDHCLGANLQQRNINAVRLMTISRQLISSIQFTYGSSRRRTSARFNFNGRAN